MDDTKTTTEQAIAWFEYRVKSTPMPGARSMFKMALSALRAQQEKSRVEWISVKDMLPDENIGKVLMTDGERHYIAPRGWMHRINGADGIYIPANHGAGANVTHWMPLPELPEEDV